MFVAKHETMMTVRETIEIRRVESSSKPNALWRYECSMELVYLAMNSVIQTQQNKRERYDEN
jgi:hypothetical protein